MYEKELEQMIALMREAAQKEILPRFGNAAEEQKESSMADDPVTQADNMSSMYILDRIRRDFPGSYSEEHKYEDRFDHDIIWQLDTVDGTREFLEGMNDGYTMNAALLKKDGDSWFPVACILYLPGMDKLWYSDGREVHMMRGGEDMKISRPDIGKIAGFVRKVDPNGKVISFYRSLGEKLGKNTEVIHGGGAGASLAAILEGKANIAVWNYDYTKEWDVAVAEPFMNAWGGSVLDLDGDPFTYNRKDVPDEPYNRQGYVISTLEKQSFLPFPNDLLIKRLTPL